MVLARAFSLALLLSRTFVTRLLVFAGTFLLALHALFLGTDLAIVPAVSLVAPPPIKLNMYLGPKLALVFRRPAKTKPAPPLATIPLHFSGAPALHHTKLKEILRIT